MMKQYFGKIIFWLGTAAEAAVIQYYLFGDFGCIGIILAGLTSLLLWGLLLTLPRGIIITALTVQALFFWLLLVWHSHFDDPLSLRLITTSYREGLQFAAVSWRALLTLPVAVMLTFTCGQLIYVLKFWRPWADRLMLRLVCGIPLLFIILAATKSFYKEGFVYTDFKFITRTAGYPSGWFYEILTDVQSSHLFDEIANNAGLPTPPLPPELKQIRLPEHLFVIQVESLDYAGFATPGVMPFLQKLAAESYVYEIRPRQRNQSANSDFMMLSKANNFEQYYFAIYTLLPPEDYKRFVSLPRKVKELGYQSAFYHGFSQRFYQRGKGIPAMGFDRWWFWDNLPIKAQEGAWGFEDGDLFDFVLDEDRRRAGQKQLHMIVTVSSHENYDAGAKQKQPHTQPKTRKEMYDNALNYVDSSLQRLIENAPQSSLFFIYSDHQSGENEDTRTLLFIYDKQNPQAFRGSVDFAEVPLLLHGLIEESVNIPRENQPAVRQFLSK